MAAASPGLARFRIILWALVVVAAVAATRGRVKTFMQWWPQVPAGRICAPIWTCPWHWWM